MPCSWGDLEPTGRFSGRPQAAGYALSSWGASSDKAHQHLCTQVLSSELCSWVFELSAASGNLSFLLNGGWGASRDQVIGSNTNTGLQGGQAESLLP